jgi:hypothetical protein
MTEKNINIQNNHQDFYSIGDVFSLHNMFYMLIEAAAYEIVLVNLSTGLKWTSSITVKDVYRITESELGNILNGKRELFVYVQELTLSGK